MSGGAERESTATASVPFDEALAQRELGDGRFAATVYRCWDGPFTTHGGILAANILRAIDSHTNADRVMQVRTLSLHFLRPPEHGNVVIVVQPLRTGRRFATAAATLQQDGRPCVMALSTHAQRGLPHVGHWQPAMPLVGPPPARDADPDESGIFRLDADHWLKLHERSPRFLNQLLVAPRFGDPVFTGPPVGEGEGTENGGWLTLPRPRPVDPELLTLFADAFWPSALQPLREPVMSPTLDLTIHYRAELPPEGLPDQPLLLHNTTAALIDGACDCDSRLFTAAGDLLAQARQLQFISPLET